MRVTLNQDELFEAISDHLRGKLNLDKSASIEISFTAGRSPKGYTADVDITYPRSDLAAKITAKDPEGEFSGTTETAPVVGEAQAAAASDTPVTQVAAAAVASANDLFAN